MRSIEKESKNKMYIADDIYDECWKHFKKMNEMQKKITEVGDLYYGDECQIDALGLKSDNSDQTIYINYQIDKDKNTIDTTDTPKSMVLTTIWMDYHGKEIVYFKDKELNAIVMTQHTFVTHPWKLYVQDEFLAAYVPTSNHEVHEIKFTHSTNGWHITCQRGSW